MFSVSKPIPILFALVFVLIPLNAGFAQKKAEKQKATVTKESKQLLKDAMEALKKAVKEDLTLERKRCMLLIVERFDGGDRNLKNSAAKALARQLKTRDTDMRDEALKALSNTGPEAAKYITLEIKGAAAKKSLAYKCDCIKALGQLQDPKSISYLLKLFHNKDQAVVVQGIDALGSYRDVDTKYKKEIVKEILKFYGPLEGAARMPTAKTDIKRKYAALRGSFESTLKSVTGKADASNADQWNRWFRKEGKKLKEW